MPPTPTVLSLFDLDPRKFGSMEEFALFLARDLRDRGCHCVLAFMKPMDDDLRGRFVQAGAVLEVVGVSEGPSLYKRLVELSRRYRPQVVHFHFFEQYSLLPVVSRLLGAERVVFTDHYRQPRRLPLLTHLQLRFWNLLVPPLFGTRILAVSEHIRRTLVDDYHASPKRVTVVRNGVNTHRFVPADPAQRQQWRVEWGVPAGHQVVVTVAALIPEKGVGDLLVAAREVLAKLPNTHFLVGGEGRLADTLRQQAIDLGVDKNVRFLGLVRDVSRLMAIADVVAAPSVWQEAAGLVILEAMACARPVVATRVGGIPEYLEDGVTGNLVEPHAPGQLASALLQLLESREQANVMGQAGRKTVESRFSLETWVRETEAHYAPIVAVR